MKNLTRIDFGPLNIPEASFPPRAVWLLDCWYVGGFDVSGNYLGSDANGKCLAGGGFSKSISFGAGSKTVTVHQLTAKVQGINAVHLRRLFVVCPYVNDTTQSAYWLKPLLLVAAPSSNGPGGDSARDLFSNPISDIQYSWPLRVASDNGIFAVLVDQSAFGWNAYLNVPPDVENSRDAIIDHVACIDAARFFIDGMPILKLLSPISGANTNSMRSPILPNLLVGGLSYGSNTSGFLAGALRDVEAVYLAGAAVNKSQFAQGTAARFRPPEWDASGYDYIDMWKASHVKKLIISFGWDNGGVAGAKASDYARVNSLWTAASVDNTCSALKAFDPSRFDWRVNQNPPVTQGHEADLPHIRQWFSDEINSLVSGQRAFSMNAYSEV